LTSLTKFFGILFTSQLHTLYSLFYNTCIRFALDQKSKSHHGSKVSILRSSSLKPDKWPNFHSVAFKIS
jgi:hypothetical protein